MTTLPFEKVAVVITSIVFNDVFLTEGIIISPVFSSQKLKIIALVLRLCVIEYVALASNDWVAVYFSHLAAK